MSKSEMAHVVAAFTRHLDSAARAIAVRLNELTDKHKIPSKSVRHIKDLAPLIPDERDREEVQALISIVIPLNRSQDDWNTMVDWMKRDS